MGFGLVQRLSLLLWLCGIVLATNAYAQEKPVEFKAEIQYEPELLGDPEMVIGEAIELLQTVEPIDASFDFSEPSEKPNLIIRVITLETIAANEAPPSPEFLSEDAYTFFDIQRPNDPLTVYIVWDYFESEESPAELAAALAREIYGRAAYITRNHIEYLKLKNFADFGREAALRVSSQKFAYEEQEAFLEYIVENSDEFSEDLALDFKRVLKQAEVDLMEYLDDVEEFASDTYVLDGWCGIILGAN